MPKLDKKGKSKLTGARKRLTTDLKKLQAESPAGVCAVPQANDIMLWHAVIFGPPETPFEDGAFKLVMQFTEQYPFKPPKVKFLSRMFHPNVYASGDICLDVLQNQWSSTMNVQAILLSIQSLLDEPNPKSPANKEAAELFTEDKIAYEKKVWACVEESWRDIDGEDEEMAGV